MNIPTPPNLTMLTRPRLAVVLGSGGVRSVAAVGVVESLARAGISPDLVVGCSSGALFGATIAAGMAPERALRAAMELWSSDLTRQRPRVAQTQAIARRPADLDHGLPLRENKLLAERLASAFGDLRLEALRTPLRVATTDATTGQSVVLTQGSVVEALLASMALPGLFPSVEIGCRRLVDGGLSEPLPVSAARDADLVITLGFEGAMPRQVDRPSRMSAQAMTALINNLTRARLDAAVAHGQRLVQLSLNLDRRVGLWETAAMPYLYEAGRRAAQDQLHNILARWGRPLHREAA